MEESGLDTQPVLAKKAGVGQSHVSRILNMRQSVGLDVVAAVAGAFGCQPWELLVDSELTRREAIERMLSSRTEHLLPPAPAPVQLLDRPAKRAANYKKPRRKP